MKKQLLLISLIFLLPVLFGYFSDMEMTYSGLTSTTDGNTYLSFMNQAKEGRILFTNMYTSEELPYLMFRPVYLFMGWFSLLTFLPNIIVYHLFRLIGVILTICYLYKLISLFQKKEININITLFIVLFGSGIGWFFWLLTNFGLKLYGSIDLWIIDANNFLIMMSHPHTILSLAFMVGAIYYFLRWNNEGSVKLLIYSGLLALFLGFEHLFDVITIYVAIGFFILIKFISDKKVDWKKVKQLAFFGLITIIPFIYTLFIFTTSYSSWNQQNLLDTPKLLHVFFGYGLMSVTYCLYLFYLYEKRKKPDENTLFLILWVFTGILLIYSPFNIQRRFLEGLHVPLGIIAGIFILNVLPKLLSKKIGARLLRAILIMLLVIMPLTNLYLLAARLNQNNGRGSFPYNVANYIFPEEKEALIWLSENSNPDEVILSSYNIGNYIPAYMNRRVYLGHWAQTIDFEKKAETVNDFYLGNINDLNNIDYIWYGVDERKINSEFIYEGSILEFENNKVKIYRITK